MPTPTLPVLDDAAAAALSGALDAATGVRLESSGAHDQSSPKAFTNLINAFRNLLLLEQANIQGMVVSLNSGLTIGAYPCRYQIGATEKTFAGSASYTLPASQTCHVYLDTDQALEHSTTGWPAGDHLKLAVVVTGATTVISVEDRRLQNFPVGAISNWWTFSPTADVNFNSRQLNNVSQILFDDWVTLTLASDVIAPPTPKNMLIRVDTQGGASTDDLVTITATAGQRQILILTSADAARVVTVRNTGNLFLRSANDYVIASPEDYLVLLQTDDSNWFELFRSAGGTLDMDFATLNHVGRINVGAQSGGHSIVSDSIVLPATGHIIMPRAESGTVDDLATITGGVDGDIIMLAVSNLAPLHTITLKHGTASAGGFLLQDARDAILDGTSVSKMWIKGISAGGTFRWNELWRSPMKLPMFADTGRGIPNAIPLFVAGALTVAVLKPRLKMQTDYVIKQASGELGTAPSGSPCIIDVRVNGSSIFANQSEMINIAVAATADTSAVKNYLGAAGDVIDLECEAANSAADLTVTLDLYLPVKTPPA